MVPDAAAVILRAGIHAVRVTGAVAATVVHGEARRVPDHTVMPARMLRHLAYPRTGVAVHVFEPHRMARCHHHHHHHSHRE